VQKWHFRYKTSDISETKVWSPSCYRVSTDTRVRPADTLGTRLSALSGWVLPAPTTTPARPMDDGGRC